MLYIKNLTSLVKNKVRELLPDRFTIIFDGWTSGSTQYVTEFAKFPSTAEKGYQKVRLGLSSMGNELSQRADEHHDFMEFVSSVIERDTSNVMALVGDNSNTNHAFASFFGRVFVDCHSHRLSLAVKEKIKELQEIVNRVHQLMRELSFSLPAASLR